MGRKIASWAAASLIAGLAGTALATGRADILDEDLAEHAKVGRLYVEAFNAGVRVPVEFRGAWSTDPKTCGIEGDDMDTRITVEPVTLHFYDETHVVTALRRHGVRSIALSYAPPIEDYHYMLAPPVLTLSEDGKSLQAFDASGKEPLGSWRKCPSG